MATGRSDLPNQLNNSLGFPGIFRGVLDVGASAITDEMALAAAHELAGFARERGIDHDHILPTMAEWEVFPRVAMATAEAAMRLGAGPDTDTRRAALPPSPPHHPGGTGRDRDLMRDGLIPGPPPAAAQP